MKLKAIKVEQKHIDGGERSNPFDCPVARAIKEQLQLDEVKVVGAVSFFAGDSHYVIELPEAAFLFLHKFDHEDPVTPFEFDLPIPFLS